MFEEIGNHAKNNVWPRLSGLVEAARELLNKELLYLNSCFSYSGITIKKIVLLGSFALFFCIITIFLFCTLIVKLILQSFPNVPPDYLLLGGALIFCIFLIALTLVIKRKLMELKNEITVLITHFKSYYDGSTKTSF